ncbi:HEPN domain-containing protein [Acetobacterium carbinolicum]|uniref:HEPN domain-containing protein n=1 Tax=Acetobacterium carbinolicum TaxID=52690 RepID=UPI0039BF1B81
MTDIREEGIPVSNSSKLHDKIGNVKTNKKELAKSAHENADEFYIGAGIIFRDSFQLIQVVSVNMAFACELYIKSMLYNYDIDFGKTHRILALYKLLPEDCQNKIKNTVQFQYARGDNFELVLEEISDAFVFLRYAHERKTIVTDWSSLLAITTAIMKVTKEIEEMLLQE